MKENARVSVDEHIQITLDSLPKSPGVYRYIGKGGDILYIGKAKNLRNRVRSYFQSSRPHNQRITLMISQIHHIEYTVVANERESLILEANLIHNLQPRYNVLLKDDRNYLYVRLTADPIPGFFLTRRRYDHRSRYFGPYTKRFGIAQTMRMLRTIFPYCQERFFKDRPCSYVGIKQCDGICTHQEKSEDYLIKINAIERILEGDIQPAEDFVLERVVNAVESGNYELAALWRDRLEILKETIGTQKVILPLEQDIDIVNVVYIINSDGMLIASIFSQNIRSGRIINVNNFLMTDTDSSQIEEVADTSPHHAVLLKYLLYRDETVARTKDILVNVHSMFEGELKRIQITSSQITECEAITSQKVYSKNTFKNNKEEISNLLQQGSLNAQVYLQRHAQGQVLSILEENNLYSYLVELQKALSLTKVPRRIECYDISHLAGTDVYGSMVTFIDGRSQTGLYRLFRTKQQNNDFENHKEVLNRRFSRALELVSRDSDVRTKTDIAWELPDLVIVDGGKGQLSSDYSVLVEWKQRFEDMGYEFPVEICGLAKREEELFVPDMSSITHAKRGSENGVIMEGGALFLVQRIRDEAHRFAITNNRKARLKKAHLSELDGIKGVGPKSKESLLKTFGSVRGIVEALDDNQELVRELVGQSVLSKLKTHFGIFHE